MTTSQTDSNTTLIEVAIHAMVYGGSGIGRLPDGRSVFVPFALPGEKVLIRLAEEKKSFCRGELVEVLVPSPQRITPRCAHYTRCGGCHYQHLAYPDQLKIKQQILNDQLTRIGKFSNPPVKPIIASAQEWHYRNTMQFHVVANGRLGFRAAGSSEVIEISECYLPEAPISELWPQVEIDPEFRVERVSVRNGVEDDLLLGLECEHDQAPEFRLDFPLSVVMLGKDSELLLSGSPNTRIRVRDFDFLVSARSFFQVNTAQAERMVTYVLEKGKFTGAKVFDLYCGVGLFSRFIAPLAEELVGVEYSESACNDYAANLEEFDNVSLYMGKTEEILPGIPVKPDVIVADPPRAGLERGALQCIAGSDARQLIYVSCDPTTLARDARVLEDSGWQLQEIQPFELFPQTFHIESISIFTRD
jgi:23S rRNA (uracil1939-C5)-methyltransferase